MKTFRAVFTIIGFALFLVTLTSCVVVTAQGNGRHRGWHKNSNNPHHPNSTNPGKPGNGKN